MATRPLGWALPLRIGQRECWAVPPVHVLVPHHMLLLVGKSKTKRVFFKHALSPAGLQGLGVCCAREQGEVCAVLQVRVRCAAAWQASLPSSALEEIICVLKVSRCAGASGPPEQALTCTCCFLHPLLISRPGTYPAATPCACSLPTRT